MKKIYILLVLMLAAQQLPAAQLVAPAMLFINGEPTPLGFSEGTIFRINTGQEVRIGGLYPVLAVPANGYKFAGWQKVQVHFFFEYYNYPYYGQYFDMFSTGFQVATLPQMSKSPLMFYQPSGETYSTSPAPSFNVYLYGWSANFVPIHQQTH
jgi:hypothetical protein